MTNLNNNTYPKEVLGYLRIILRNQLSIINGNYPVDIKNEEIEKCLENKEVGNYEIRCREIKSIINGKSEISYSVALVDKETGMWYNNEIINKK